MRVDMRILEARGLSVNGMCVETLFDISRQFGAYARARDEGIAGYRRYYKTYGSYVIPSGFSDRARA